MRKIENEMVEYIDAKLASNGLAKIAIQKKDARTLFRLAAEACVGIQERTGRNDGRMIELIQETVGGASGEPYCLAGVQTCGAYAELKTGVKFQIFETEHCQTAWQKTPKKQRVKTLPLPGAVAFWFDVGKSTGHVEIVLGCDGDSFQAVGFNTSGTTTPGGEVNREGNGVFYTVRSMKSSKKRKLVGFLIPFPKDAEQVVTPTPMASSDVSMPWDGEHKDANSVWTPHLIAAVTASTLPDEMPADLLQLVPSYDKISRPERAVVWSRLIAKMCEFESSYNPAAKYTESFDDAKGAKVISRGLLQISIESARGYDKTLKTPSELHDPLRNLEVGVKILERWVARDKVVSGRKGGTHLGGGRYWSVLRLTSKSQPKILAYLKTVY